MSRHTGKVPGTKKRPIPPHKQVCVIVGDMEDPVVAVAWSQHRSAPSDSGYTLLTSSAPPSPDEVGDDDAGTYCLACAAEAHPEATQGSNWRAPTDGRTGTTTPTSGSPRTGRATRSCSTTATSR